MHAALSTSQKVVVPLKRDDRRITRLPSVAFHGLKVVAPLKQPVLTCMCCKAITFHDLKVVAPLKRHRHQAIWQPTLRHNIASIMKALSIRAHQKDLGLVYEMVTGVPGALLGDPTRLRQVLLNLVGNALRFTSNGEVMLRVEQVEKVEDKVPSILPSVIPSRRRCSGRTWGKKIPAQ
jgi:hypothetical protein